MEDVKAVEDSASSISPAQSGSVEQILVAAGAKGTPRVAVERVLAVTGKGLEGDRYFGRRPGRYAADRQVTLIEAEAVDAVRAGGVPFTAVDARRNLVTRGVRLNALVGRTFRVGGAVLRGVELCHPCGHLAKLTYRGVTRDLKMRGGLRAAVLEGGEIRAGDALAEV
ncbi:MAG TPA: MOSC domain-containing protein [Longimicrobium sp.]|nr:MOSC domain-containing protein [Longimicrobium sp.]